MGICPACALEALGRADVQASCARCNGERRFRVSAVNSARDASLRSPNRIRAAFAEVLFAWCNFGRTLGPKQDFGHFRVAAGGCDVQGLAAISGLRSRSGATARAAA